MSVLERLACSQNRRDDVPNQELAGDLAGKGDWEGIREIASNLWNSDKNVQADCIKVLYEIGYIKPELIQEYADDFIRLLSNKNNRMVWGGMIALSTVAALKPRVIAEKIEPIQKTIASGSVITVDNGIKALALAASADESFSKKISPYLLDHLKSCRPKEVPLHAEYILPAINGKNKKVYSDILRARLKIMNSSQAKRVQKILKSISKNTEK